MKYYEDPILGKGRAADVSGGTGGGGTEYIGGYRITIAGQTISTDRYMPIESVSGNTVTLMAGHAYKAYATSTAITLNTETIPANQFGLEGHIELFVSGTGYVVTGSNVVLAQALEPDSVNNCTLRFHDGLCIISVEDHVAGYIVVSATGSTAGTLPYALSTASQEYVAFDASLNGMTIDMGGATTNGEKHVVGNGYTETILTGGVSCTSKTTFANLAMSAAVVTGGTATLGDVYIPQGGTVSVSGGLAIEKVTGNGGVIDLLSTSAVVSSGTSAIVTGCTVNGAGVSVKAINIASGGTLTMSSCTIIGGSVRAIQAESSCKIVLAGGATCAGKIFIYYNGTDVTFMGANECAGVNHSPDASGTVTISAGASINLTSSIDPGGTGGIEVVGGTCTVNGSAIEAGTYTSIDSTGTPT